jgi:hypothetical protein
MKITSDLTNLTTAILILTVQMFFEWTLFILFFNTFLCHSLKVKAAVGADCFQNNTCSNALIRTKFMISIL